jgi:hypothetical protein
MQRAIKDCACIESLRTLEVNDSRDHHLQLNKLLEQRQSQLANRGINLRQLVPDPDQFRTEILIVVCRLQLVQH